MNFKSKLAQQFFDLNIQKVEDQVKALMAQVDALFDDMTPEDSRALFLVAVQLRIKNFRKISMNACEIEMGEVKANLEAAALLSTSIGVR